MTHSCGLPHNIGDCDQRYEVWYIDGRGDKHIMGWTNTANGGGLASAIEKHPVWKLAWIIDRQAVTAVDGQHAAVKEEK